MSTAQPQMAWPDDLLLVSGVQQFLAEFRSAACYPDLVGMTYPTFERLDATEKGRVFEESLGRFITKKVGRRFQVITAAGSLDFGLGLGTPSGIRHEVDLVITNGATLYAFEAKHYLETEITKDLLAVFNQKTLDFYLELLRRGQPVSLKRLFVARTNAFKFKVREFAWSWGIALLGSDQPHPVWLQNQLARWLDTRVASADLVENARVAVDLSLMAMRDLADLIAPFSTRQASIRLDRLLDPEQCEALVQKHEKVCEYWSSHRSVTAPTGVQ